MENSAELSRGPGAAAASRAYLEEAGDEGDEAEAQEEQGIGAVCAPDGSLSFLHKHLADKKPESSPPEGALQGSPLSHPLWLSCTARPTRRFIAGAIQSHGTAEVGRDL